MLLLLVVRNIKSEGILNKDRKKEGREGEGEMEAVKEERPSRED